MRIFSTNSRDGIRSFSPPKGARSTLMKPRRSRTLRLPRRAPSFIDPPNRGRPSRHMRTHTTQPSSYAGSWCSACHRSASQGIGLAQSPSWADSTTSTPLNIRHTHANHQTHSCQTSRHTHAASCQTSDKPNTKPSNAAPAPRSQDPRSSPGSVSSACYTAAENASRARRCAPRRPPPYPLSSSPAHTPAKHAPANERDFLVR